METNKRNMPKKEMKENDWKLHEKIKKILKGKSEKESEEENDKE